ncbi:alpha/beta fold hydrolase [Streptomyces asiaticus]
MTSQAVRRLRDEVRRDRALVEQAMTSVPLADGSTIRMARFGSGPAVVCAATVPELGFVYAPQIRALSERYQVVLYDPRVSRSARVSLADRARELTAVADTLERPSVHILSWSDAGATAYLAASRHPDRFESVTFMGLPDVYAFPGPVTLLAQGLYRWPIERAVPAFALRLLLSHYLSGPRLPRAWLHEEVRRIDALPRYVRHSVLPLMLEHRPVHGELPMRSLMIMGDRDRLVPLRRMRAMAKALGPRCEPVLVPGGEHILGYGAPGPVNEALDRFYTSVGTAR